MYFKIKLRILASAVVLSLFSACATQKTERVLTPVEQIEVDTQRARSLFVEFESQASFVSNPKAQRFLTQVARNLAKQEPALQGERVRVTIHDDRDPKLTRFFSFPGTIISVPFSFLKRVEFENELAASLAFELANVMNRNLARKVETIVDEKPQLLGSKSVFNLTAPEKVESIRRGMQFLYYAGYDTRGMASIFRQYPAFYVHSGASDLFRKEVDFNVREAQRAKSEFLPSLKPIVRSADFIQFKKELSKKE